MAKHGKRMASVVSFGGAVVEYQPKPKSNTYGYRLKCRECGWTGGVRTADASLMGRFDCESCGKSNNFTVSELQN